MPEEPSPPPLPLLIPAALMLGVHALAMAAASHLPGAATNWGAANWGQRVWGFYNLTAAVLLLGLLAYALRKAGGKADKPLKKLVWGACAADLVATACLAAVAFG